jgi:hypothetical protein
MSMSVSGLYKIGGDVVLVAGPLQLVLSIYFCARTILSSSKKDKTCEGGTCYKFRLQFIIL